MAAPEYVPVTLRELPRPIERIPPAKQWLADRPADLQGGQPRGKGLGVPGPDQGYALKLARRFDDRLELAAGEHHEDAVIGCMAVALKRAALFGRAPVIYDVELAFTLWGFLGGAPDDLVDFRTPRFQGLREEYERQRVIADLVPDTTLRLTPAQVRERLSNWRSLLTVGGD